MSILDQVTGIVEDNIYSYIGDYYDVDVKAGDTLASIQVTCSPKDQDLPDLTIATEGLSDTSAAFRPTLQFPDLTFDGQESYADDIHYIIGKWYKLADGITSLNKFVFDINDYELNEE